MRVVVNQATAVLVTSCCLNEVSKVVTKSVNEPKEIVVPEMQLVQKVVAHVRAEPFVI